MVEATFGRYVIRRRIGAGGMGVVDEAYDPELDRRVALKRVRVDGAGPDDTRADAPRDRLLREAQLTAKLAHPNVVAIYDVGRLGDDVFIAMELVDGPTLGAWLQQAKRGWREVLAIFRQAGLGLAAAHQAQLVHRDFKPDNVLVGLDGRARVLDFGLSHAVDAVAEAHDPSPVTAGTPRYMSPEQYLGRRLDPRSDQFSFCVALWEALAGVRPFAPTEYRELGEAVIRGELTAPPHGRMPLFVRRALERGLSPHPEDRFPSMEALLAALDRDPRRRILQTVAALGSAVLVAGIVLLLGGHRPTPCAGSEGKLAGVWDAPRREAARRAFQATGAPFADDAWRGAAAQLDAYAQELVTRHREVCEATHVRGEQSAALLDLKMECLGRRLDELAAVAALFGRADQAVVERAVAAAQGLSPLAECLDGRRLGERRRPTSEQLFTGEVRRRLAEVHALGLAGYFPDGLALARGLIAPAVVTGDRTVEAQALYELGDLQSRNGDPRTAERTLSAAAQAALAGRDPRFAALAYLALGDVVGQEEQVAERGLEHLRTAAALVESVGGDTLLEGRIARAEGIILLDLGRGPEALARMERAHLLIERARGPAHVDVASAWTDLGGAYRAVGRYPEAIAAHEKALALRRRLLGNEHPFVATTLLNLGNVDYSQGRQQSASAYYAQAVALRERSLGRDHPRVADALFALSQSLDSLGRRDEALAALVRARGIYEKAYGPDHPDVGRTLNVTGDVLLGLGRKPEALASYRRALAIKEKALGPDHPSIAVSVYSIGNVLLALEDAQGALAAFERALTIDTAASGADSVELAFDLTGIGRAHLALGNPRAAIPPLERALSLRSPAGGDPTELAETQFFLARALWDTAPARARTLARDARAAFAAAGEGRREDLKLVDEWLAKH